MDNLDTIDFIHMRMYPQVSKYMLTFMQMHKFHNFVICQIKSV